MFFYIFPFWFHIWLRNIYSRWRNPFLGLPALLNRSSECGRTKFLLRIIFFYRMIWSSLSRSSHKNNISVSLISWLMLSSVDSKTLVVRKRGFSTYSYSFFSKMKPRAEIWRKTYISPLCFFAILHWLPIMPLWAWSHLSVTQLIPQFLSKMTSQVTWNIASCNTTHNGSNPCNYTRFSSSSKKN